MEKDTRCRMQDAGCRMRDAGWRTKGQIVCCFAFAVFLFMGFSSFVGPPEDTAKQVAAALQAGNAAEVAKHFNPMVDLSLPGSDDTYSKTQAGQILKEFFVNHPVKSFKVSKQGSSADGSTYCIGTMEAGGKSYRVYYLIRQVGGQDLVQQLQVQENT